MEFTKQELKQVALEIIRESNISIQDKIELLEYLKESDEYQTMVFLTKGQFLREDIVIDEKRKILIEDEITTFFKNTVAVTAILIGLYKTLAMLIKRYLTKEGKLCKHLYGSNLAKCKAKVKIGAYEKSISKIKSSISSCNKSSNPKECKIKLNELIKNYEDKIKDLKFKL